jgi:hypothetical protein
MKDPLERDNGVNRDPNDGSLKLDSTHSAFNYLWLAGTGQGTVSKIDTKTVREVARYMTVTCFSLKSGSQAACDGTNGCCSIDDWERYQARKAKKNQPGHQAVHKDPQGNAPSRTAVDFNGDLFISNRAFGGQSSVTKVANDTANCLDRNRNGRIDTSKDTNGNGFIEVDCNNDGMLDDWQGVKAKPCANGLPQEFWGLDDECILWTSNTFVPNAVGRPLGLAAGANDSNVSDAWAGSYNNGNFVRIDGSTGLDKDDTQLPGGCNPYGLAVDASGVGWAPNLGQGKLCYFNTRNTQEVGSARGTMNGYGITLDRDQNVWVGLSPARYTPDRSNGFKNLGSGWWTTITGASGIGIAADSRGANEYWVWWCQGGQVIGAPSRDLPIAKMDQNIPLNNAWPHIPMQCRGVGIDPDQNVWGAPGGGAWRAIVDKKAVFKNPQQAAPQGNNKCPAGDVCPLDNQLYTYSDFTGFGLRNFTRPQGTYSAVVSGCKDNNNLSIDTQWFSVLWDADVPPNTSLTVHARASSSADLNDGAWTNAKWTDSSALSPFNLQGPLTPNVPADKPDTVANDPYLQVEFTFKSMSQNASPKLRSFLVGYKCGKIPG